MGQKSKNLKGPTDVQNRILLDRLSEDTLFKLKFMQPYYEWKEEILEKYNYTYALAYYPIFMKASDSMVATDDNAASGVVHFSGF